MGNFVKIAKKRKFLQQDSNSDHLGESPCPKPLHHKYLYTSNHIFKHIWTAALGQVILANLKYSWLLLCSGPIVLIIKIYWILPAPLRNSNTILLYGLDMVQEFNCKCTIYVARSNSFLSWAPLEGWNWCNCNPKFLRII